MTEVRIERAAREDAAALARAYRSAYRENRQLGFPAKAESATERDVAEWIRESRVYAASVGRDATSVGRDATSVGRDATTADGDAAVEDGSGGVVGGVRLEATGPDRLKLSRLAVRDDWKGEGVGSQLLAHAEEVARDDGDAVVWLTTPAAHSFLPDLYRRRGHEVTGEYPLEYRDYDEVVMEKWIG